MPRVHAPQQSELERTRRLLNAMRLVMHHVPRSEQRLRAFVERTVAPVVPVGDRNFVVRAQRLGRSTTVIFTCSSVFFRLAVLAAKLRFREAGHPVDVALTPLQYAQRKARRVEFFTLKAAGLSPEWHYERLYVRTATGLQQAGAPAAPPAATPAANAAPATTQQSSGTIQDYFAPSTTQPASSRAATAAGPSGAAVTAVSTAPAAPDAMAAAAQPPLHTSTPSTSAAAAAAGPSTARALAAASQSGDSCPDASSDGDWPFGDCDYPPYKHGYDSGDFYSDSLLSVDMEAQDSQRMEAANWRWCAAPGPCSDGVDIPSTSVHPGNLSQLPTTPPVRRSGAAAATPRRPPQKGKKMTKKQPGGPTKRAAKRAKPRGASAEFSPGFGNAGGSGAGGVGGATG